MLIPGKRAVLAETLLGDRPAKTALREAGLVLLGVLLLFVSAKIVVPM